MPNETGDNKIIGNFRKLIDEVSAEANYNPANTKIKLPALNAQYTAADGAIDAVASALAPNKLAITDRETAFDDLRPLAVRSRNFLKASGAAKGIADDADQFVRKLSGGAKKPKAKPASPTAPAPTAPAPTVTHSSSQMSYDNQVGHFRSYI